MRRTNFHGGKNHIVGCFLSIVMFLTPQDVAAQNSAVEAARYSTGVYTPSPGLPVVMKTPVTDLLWTKKAASLLSHTA